MMESAGDMAGEAVDLETRASNAVSMSVQELADLESEIIEAFNQADDADDVDRMTSLAEALNEVRNAAAAAQSMPEQEPIEAGGMMPKDDLLEGEVVVEVDVDDDEDDKEYVMTASADKTPETAEETVVADAQTASEQPASEEDTTAVVAAADGHKEAENMDIPSDRQPVAAQPLVTVTAGADLPGKSAGTPFNSADEVASAMLSRINTISRASGGDGEQHIVATVTAAASPERVLSSQDAEGNLARIQELTSPQAVTASGWCAPLESRYELFGAGVTNRPVRDALVGFQATRGGIRFTEAPMLGDLTGAVGRFTADGGVFDSAGEAVTPAVKPCLLVACGDEVTVELDAVTLCLEFGNMQSRAYPELVTRNNDLALIEHSRFAENLLLSGIKAGSTAVTASSLWGTTRDVFVALDKAIAAYRFKHRLLPSFPLRGIAPQYLKDAMRADLLVGLPGDNLRLADATIEQFLSDRNVSFSWHLDGLSTGPAYDFAAVGWEEFPATAEIALFAEGTWLFLDGGTLDLGVVRDSTLVGTNSYKTFVETFENVAKVGHDSLWITADITTLGAVYGTLDPAPAI